MVASRSSWLSRTRPANSASPAPQSAWSYAPGAAAASPAQAAPVYGGSSRTTCANERVNAGCVEREVRRGHDDVGGCCGRQTVRQAGWT